MIKKVKDGYKVVSSKGRNLGGPYKTLEEAKKRLHQVDFSSIANHDEVLREGKADARPAEFTRNKRGTMILLSCVCCSCNTFRFD